MFDTPEGIQDLKGLEGADLQLVTETGTVSGAIKAESKAIGLLDWVVLFGYAAVVVGIGVLASRKERDGDDFFLGGRSIHWSLAGLTWFDLKREEKQED